MEPASQVVTLTWVEAFWLGYVDASYDQMEECYKRVLGFYHTMQKRLPFFRVWNRSYELRLLTALIAQSTGTQRRRWLARLRRIPAKLMRENWDHATAFALQAEATLALVRSETRVAADCLERSARLFEQNGGRLYSAANRYWSARIGGDRAKLESTSEFIRSLNVAHVGRMAHAHAPGLAKLLAELGS